MRSTFRIVCRRQCLANADTNVTNQLKAGIDQTARCLVTVTALSNNRLLDPKDAGSSWGSPLAVAIPSRGIRRSTNMEKQDYYQVLGIPRNATQKDIKKAYYKLAKKYHPDVNKDPDAHTSFQQVSEAYEVLGDEAKKNDYDMFGMGGGGASAGTGRGPFQQQAHTGRGFESFHSTIDPEELFRKIFGDAGFRMSGFNDYSDFADSNFGFAAASEVTMNLTFQQAARGVNKEIEINVTDTCPRCGGNKAEPGTRSVRCHHCNGTGMETVSTGPFVMRTTCRHCYGTRVLIKTPCIECEGKGKTVQRKRVMVPVPAGVEDGQTVRMPVGSKEIFITFRVEKSKDFRREGADVHSDLGVSLSQAILGGTIRIPGIYDDILLNIPPGTSSHTRIRLTGKGISRTHSYGFGDHYVHIKVKVPTTLSPQQKSLILAFAETEADVGGTVNGVTDTTHGKQVIDDKDGIVSRLREAIHDKPDTPDVEFEEKVKGKEILKDNSGEQKQEKSGEEKCDNKEKCDEKEKCENKEKCDDKDKCDDKKKGSATSSF
ncbi:hypothetical protein LSAT2_023874 [Lamellibrachia satsuma]|nr:hypothetical protein LSAT2_023874 [Lamellibrachia satsuma]